MGEDGNSNGIGGDQSNNESINSGAVYLFMREGNDWAQRAYLKASNTGPGDEFGLDLELSTDGSLLLVGAIGEDSMASGVGGEQDNEDASGSGAVYAY